MPLPSAKDSLPVFTDDMYRTIFDNAGIAIIVVEGDTTISIANSEFCAMTGFSKEEIENRMSWTNFVTADMFQAMHEFHHLRHSAPDALPKKCQSRLHDKAGKIYDVLLHVSPIPGSDRTISSITDITAKVLLEKDIIERDNAFILLGELQTIFNAMPGTLSLISPDMTLAWTNRNNRSRHGQPAVNVLGEKCYAAYHGRNEPCPDCPIIECFATGEAHSARIQTAGGAMWDVKGFPVKDAEGNILCAIDFAEDVTKKAQLEYDAERSAHLASIGKLAAGVAHEINNPVNGIINYAQILINRNSSGETHDIASRIVSEGTRIAGIVRSLLSFARQDSEEKLPVAVRDIIEESLTLGSAMLKRDAIQLELSIADKLPRIHANAQQIQQVLLNLLSNAQYALNAKIGEPKNKKLLITAGPSADGKFVNISFHDNGIGISSENIEKIMLPFFTTKPTGKGTGLGLSISHGIISDHNGKLSVKSEQGTSTTVTITLPAIKEGA
jgi:PAS domain S-box-containing protein